MISNSSSPHVALFVPTLEAGGAERIMLTLSSWLSRRGYNVDLLLARATGDYIQEIPQNIRIIDFNSSGVIKALPWLVSYLVRVKPAVLLSTLDHANVIAVIARYWANVNTRLVLREANTASAKFSNLLGMRNRLISLMIRYAYPHADKIVAVSEGVAIDLCKQYDVADNKVSVIYNPIITERLIKQSNLTPDHPWYSDNRPIILGVGSLTPQKDFACLIKAFAKLPEKLHARLIILGEGCQRSYLELLIENLGVKNSVSLPGFATNPFSYMKKAKLFVLSSRWEGLPGTLIQALACGAYVISTDCPSGPSEILCNGKYGTLVPVGDHESLAIAIENILTSKNIPTRMTDRVLNKFTANYSMEKYEKILFSENCQAV